METLRYKVKVYIHQNEAGKVEVNLADMSEYDWHGICIGTHETEIEVPMTVINTMDIVVAFDKQISKVRDEMNHKIDVIEDRKQKYLALPSS